MRKFFHGFGLWIGMYLISFTFIAAETGSILTGAKVALCTSVVKTLWCKFYYWVASPPEPVIDPYYNYDIMI